MSRKPSYQELEAQVAKLQKQNELYKLHFAASDDGKVNYYNSILNSMGDAVFVKDNQSRILIVNDAFCKLFDLSRKHIIGKTLAEDVSPEEREVFLSIDKEVLKTGQENLNEESLTVRGGETRIIFTRKTRYIDGYGNKFIIGVIRDITDKHLAEKALHESELRLKDLNKTKDKLFSVIAHDLRGPFQSILSLSEFLIDNEAENGKEDVRNYGAHIFSTAKTTLDLLDNLLSWSKSQIGALKFNPQSIELSNIVDQVLTVSASQAEIKNISIQTKNIHSVRAIADQNMLKAILLNLISNAIKFTNSGGEIKISVTEKEEQIEVSITDNGVGVSQDRLKRLFNSPSNDSTYGTANERGTGLGLLLCKEFAEKQGGEIWVESTEGVGSDFRFTLPKDNS